jgi:hypothetical protein
MRSKIPEVKNRSRHRSYDRRLAVVMAFYEFLIPGVCETVHVPATVKFTIVRGFAPMGLRVLIDWIMMIMVTVCPRDEIFVNLENP